MQAAPCQGEYPPGCALYFTLDYNTNLTSSDSFPPSCCRLVALPVARQISEFPKLDDANYVHVMAPPV